MIKRITRKCTTRRRGKKRRNTKRKITMMKVIRTRKATKVQNSTKRANIRKVIAPKESTVSSKRMNTKRNMIFMMNITRMGNMRNMADIITNTKARKVDTRRRDTQILLDASIIMVRRSIMKRAIIIVSKKVESSMKVTTVIINMIENMERRVDTNRGKNGSPVVVIKFLNDEVVFLNMYHI
ncbi:LOW QUALITY PROTEIN: uncharacterized protein LOC102671851 [Apis dorsata]|uniref:LOW QUALITY PROTEIN: uncharacterized protein LOC102671851 n=1 Tax=Apis dorsata TaxID=7462 RepID=UPI0012933D4F|nr:LOW QUALITY PROTEIN: uncharacterized protein LOC102671851 [Apis dorsata]